MSKWRIESDGGDDIKVIDENGYVVANNEQYYPKAISLYHANRIVNGLNNFNRLKVAIQTGNFAAVQDLLND